MDYKKIGQRIRRQRKELGMTQEDLANLLDLSPTFVGLLERGERSMSLQTLAMLCRVLEKSPEWMLGWKASD